MAVVPNRYKNTLVGCKKKNTPGGMVVLEGIFIPFGPVVNNARHIVGIAVEDDLRRWQHNGTVFSSQQGEVELPAGDKGLGKAGSSQGRRPRGQLSIDRFTTGLLDKTFRSQADGGMLPHRFDDPGAVFLVAAVNPAVALGPGADPHRCGDAGG
jgi:hypothetical protein